MFTVKRLARFGKYLTGASVLGYGLYIGHKHDWDFRNVGLIRFGRTVFAAGVIVADYKITLYGLDRSSPQYAQKQSLVHRRSAERLRAVAYVNGGVFIKVGQHLGALEYLLPPEYFQTFQVLHNDAPQSSLADVKKVIREDLGKNCEEIFSDFDSVPIGTASLAQVHKALLLDGSIVAVKVQHPMVKAHSFIDMKTMEYLVEIVARIFPEFKFKWLVEETKRNLPKELDFYHEGLNAERIRRLLAKFEFLKVPKIFWDQTSARVLTMEFCNGGKVTDKDYIKMNNISVDELSENLGKLYSEMIFVKGYVHSDPHPGNILVKKTRTGMQLVLLDHGLYATLSDEFRLNYSKLWLALINSDLDGIKSYSKCIGSGDLYPLFACMVTGRTWETVESGIDKKTINTAETIEIKQMASQYLVQIIDVLNRVSREMILIFKTNDLLRGIEFCHGTYANAKTFITMSRCCVRAVYFEELRHCDDWRCRIVVTFRKYLTLLKINVYELYLRFHSYF